METSSDSAETNDYDSPWKEALELYFPQFMALLFPEVYCEIDWTIPHVFLETELQQVVRDAESGRNYTDKLIKVYTLTGEETWVLIHVEIQGKADAEFNQRMYRYHYRLTDYHPQQQIASFAILTDQAQTKYLGYFQKKLWKTQIQFTFPVLNLRDWRKRWAELETSDNPFAMVVLAQLLAHQTSKHPLKRKEAKFKLIRLLYERGYQRKDILELLRFIDWMLSLPKELELQLRQDMSLIAEEQKMKYVTSWERLSKEEGMQLGKVEGMQLGKVEGIQLGKVEGMQLGKVEGIQLGKVEGIQLGEALTLLKLLKLKFRTIPVEIEQKVNSANKTQLDYWIENILTAESLAGLFSKSAISQSE